MTRNNHMTRYVVGFESLGKADTAIAGGKGANLGELIRAGLAAMDHSGVRDDLRAALDVALGAAERPAELASASDRLQGLVRKAGIPPDIRNAVLDAYHSLGPDVRVAVRSSATSPG